MRRSLSPHPDFPCAVLGALSVEVERPTAQRLVLRYRLEGVTRDLVFPPDGAGRADELWKHTCLEAFVRDAGVSAYREFNVAGHGTWAAYRFDGYRQGMTNAAIPPPQITAQTDGPSSATFTIAWDLDLSADAPWQVGVTAVIEAADGSLSYWALAHSPGRPDFHNADCFTLELAAPQAT
jgi:hypothetical protein